MESHISFLKEQDAMFLERIGQRVREAGDHVSMVQAELDRSYQAALAYMMNLDDILQKVCAAVYHSLYRSQRVETLRRFGL